MRRTDTLMLALSAAIAIHLLVAVAAGLLWPRREPRPPVPYIWMAVELVVPKEPPPPPPSRPTIKAQVKPRRRARPPARRSRAALAPRPAPARPPMSLRMRPLDLSSSPDLFAHELEGPQVRAGRGGGAEGPRAARSRRADAARDRLARWLHRDAGRRNVELGRAPPVLFTLLRRVQRRFAPTEAVVPERLRHAGRELLAAYKAGIEAFNQMGSPLPFDRQGYGVEVSPPRLLEGNAAIKRGVKTKGYRQLATEICVEAPRDQHPSIATQRGSGSRALDRLARRAMERAVAVAPVPADARSSRACYRFEVDYGRDLPTPTNVIGALFTGKCPAGRFFRHRVRLAATWPM